METIVDRLVYENKAVLSCVTTSGGNKLESIGASRGGIAWLIAQAICDYNKEQEYAQQRFSSR